MKIVFKFLGRLALIAFGLVISLLMLEIGARLAHLAPPPDPNPTIWEPHPLLGWGHIPNSGGLFHNNYNEFETEVRINARGLRDREIGYDKPAGALRLLSLADSFGESLQVNLEQTYYKQLETLLARSLGRPVEVINGGVGGWGTDQEAIFYVSEGFRYQPDVVVLSFFMLNDTLNNYGPLEIERNGGSQQKEFFTLAADGALIPPPTPQAMAKPNSSSENSSPSNPPLLGIADQLWLGSALYRLLAPYLRDMPAVVQTVGPSGILGGEGVVRAHHPALPVQYLIYQSPPDERFEAAWQLTEAIIARLRDEVEKRGAKLVVVMIAAPEQVYPAQWQRLLAAYPALSGLSLHPDTPNRRLESFLIAQNIPHLDLLPIFRQASARPDALPLYLRHDGHWTVAGHRLAAQSLHDFLLTEPSVLPGKN